MEHFKGAMWNITEEDDRYSFKIEFYWPEAKCRKNKLKYNRKNQMSEFDSNWDVQTSESDKMYYRINVWNNSVYWKTNVTRLNWHRTLGTLNVNYAPNEGLWIILNHVRNIGHGILVAHATHLRNHSATRVRGTHGSQLRFRWYWQNHIPTSSRKW